MRSNESDLSEYFRASGLRCTAQRYIVLEYLCKGPVHAAADEIFAALNRRLPLVSLATVYNTLRELTEAGLVREFPSEGKAARFDANLHPHHHFVCDACGKVDDIDWFEIPERTRKPALGARSIRDYEVIFHGTCERCGKSPAAH